MIALFWKWVVSLLVWLSADSHRLNAEPARCAAAVAAARASMVGADAVRVGVEAVPTPQFDAHAEKCKRCKDMNPNGPGLCDEGFRLLQEDLKANQKK
jgi:hypothetical protein